MRRRHRSSITVRIARLAPIQDVLAGKREAFSAPHQMLAAFCAPHDGNTQPLSAGLVQKETLQLILPPCADIKPSDGIWLQDEALPSFRCVQVQRYPLHTRAVLERRA